MKSEKISRRDFLKLSGLGLAGLFTPPLNFHFDDPFTDVLGRVTTRMIWMYDHPSSEATRVKFCQRDALLNITNTTVSDDVTAHNRVWYEIGTEGFVYSGYVQPVRTILNMPRMDIPVKGLLAEISVPFTDAHKTPDKTSKVAYRMYYETTHWIKSVTTSEDGQVWYQVRDDKFDELYYARAEHLRIMVEEELAPLSAHIPNTNKNIQVQLDEQIMVAYENNQPVFVAPVSTGGIYRVGTYTTPKGSFITYYKRPSRHMAAGDIAASGFDLAGVPWVQYITESGISFHGTFWHNDFGRPHSHGCINLSMQTAKWLYRWTSPQVSFNKEFSFGGVGTNVEIVL
jgi:lipoprotein-anchoring transpeptidase ErfK/SrfK